MAQRVKGETLQDLVTRLLSEHDMSGREFARQAENRGFTVSYTTINSIANGTRHHVTDDTLSAIAQVFGVPDSQVRLAAGVPARDDATDPQLMALHKSLSPEEKEAALRTYREYVRTIKGLREGRRK